MEQLRLKNTALFSLGSVQQSQQYPGCPGLPAPKPSGQHRVFPWRPQPAAVEPHACASPHIHPSCPLSSPPPSLKPQPPPDCCPDPPLPQAFLFLPYVSCPSPLPLVPEMQGLSPPQHGLGRNPDPPALNTQTPAAVQTAERLHSSSESGSFPSSPCCIMLESLVSCDAGSSESCQPCFYTVQS